MRITFALPTYARVPSGGHKIVYEYANRLQSRGHQVTVVHSRSWTPKITRAERLEAVVWAARNRVLDRGTVPWFPMDPQVTLLFTPDLQSKYLPEADVLVATSWHTARWVADAPANRGRKFYLIQHHETWCGEESEVNATWRLPLQKIVVSRWLQGIAAELGEEDRTTFIPCGLDFEVFRLTRSLDERPTRVGMLYHAADWKGASDGIAALELARAEHPSVQAVLFGVDPRPKALPGWIEYIRRPSPEQHVALYNSCAIFLQPSWSEGWGLPATESMICGCALVSTENGGSGTYAFENETALLAPARNPRALADRILELLRDDAARVRIARAGRQYVQRFTWSRAVAEIEELFTDAVASSARRRAESA